MQLTYYRYELPCQLQPTRYFHPLRPTRDISYGLYPFIYWCLIFGGYSSWWNEHSTQIQIYFFQYCSYQNREAWVFKTICACNIGCRFNPPFVNGWTVPPEMDKWMDNWELHHTNPYCGWTHRWTARVSTHKVTLFYGQTDWQIWFAPLTWHITHIGLTGWQLDT